MLEPTLTHAAAKAAILLSTWLTAGVLPSPGTEAPSAAVAEYVHCTSLLQQGQWNEYDRACMAPEFVRHDPESSEVGRGDALALWQRVHVAFPDVRIEPQFVVAQGDDVFSVLLVTGTHDGILHCHGDWAATHRPLHVLAVRRVKLDTRGRVREEWLAYDIADVFSQLGLPLPDSGEQQRARAPGPR